MVSPITNKVIFMGTFTVDSLCLFFSLSAVYLLLQLLLLTFFDEFSFATHCFEEFSVAFLIIR